MKTLLCFLLFACGAMIARATEAKVIRLWPEGVPGRKANAVPEYEKDGRIYNVQDPALYYFPGDPAKANGTAVIICPGGGYVRLAVGPEGGDLGVWLRSLGITTFVLKYRLAEFGHPAPLQDVLRAMRIVRSRAAEFGIDPQRLGLFGGSAGGHLAACAGTLYDHPAGRTGSPLDAVDARPDFLMLVYPVISMDDDIVHAQSREALLGKHPDPALQNLLSVEKHVTARTPPTWIMHTQEDKGVVPENSLHFYAALLRAGVPAELHIYEKGEHGVGMKPGLGTTSDWPQQAAAWLKMRGLLDRR